MCFSRLAESYLSRASRGALRKFPAATEIIEHEVVAADRRVNGVNLRPEQTKRDIPTKNVNNPPGVNYIAVSIFELSSMEF